MIPLTLFLIIWLILLGIYGFLALVSVIQMMRFAISSRAAYVTTTVYLSVTAIVIILTAIFLFSVDWSLSLEFGNNLETPLF